MKTDTGGPAFPASSFIVPKDLHDEGCRKLGETQGMTLRDYFAAKAMQTIIAKLPLRPNPTDKEFPDAVAAGAYDYADAMIAARNGQ